MNTQVKIEPFLELSADIPIVDVRSPKEFEHAHMAGAFNIPLFSNEERAKVGICYKQKGREGAIMLGLELVGPKLLELAQKAKKIAKGKKVLVHCWRGGMRSANMAWLFNTVGIKTYTLEGGYKSYRRFIKTQFAKEANLIVLGGMTGSGKTEILKELVKHNQQVINLEELANHKGSAFGALGENKQCSTEQFENNLFEIWKNFNLQKPIWIEDESKTIGKIWLPDEIYTQIRSCPVINIEVPVEERIEYLVKEYGKFPAKELKESILKIKKRLGGKNTQIAVEAVENKQLKKATRIILSYYDKTYNYGLSKRNTQSINTLCLKKVISSDNAKEILSFFNDLNS